MMTTNKAFRFFNAAAAAVLLLASCGDTEPIARGTGPAFAPVREASDTIATKTSALAGSDHIFDTNDNQLLPGYDNQGWWSPTAHNRDDNDNYIMGRLGSDLYRNFFTFDLGGLNLSGRTVTKAALALSAGSSSSGATETIGLYEVSTDPAALNQNDGASEEIFDDLGSGDSYGSRTFSPFGWRSTMVLELNETARADIEAAAGGFFSVGGSLESINGFSDDFIFGNTHGGGGTQRLLLCFDVDPDGDGDGYCDAIDNCPLVASPLQDDFNGDGIGDACSDDDFDGIAGGDDNCPLAANSDQADSDGDGLGDACDICPSVSDPDQLDSDGDWFGDACDNCPTAYNWDQTDSDSDGLGDMCEDSDGDGAFDVYDNCPSLPNPDQLDADFDWRGDACDNCPTSYNWDQNDSDGDGLGDMCEDSDGDGAFDYYDNCLEVPNPDQLDADWDWRGDACDNCASVSNWEQTDSDGDGVGDACLDSEGDGVPDLIDNCPSDQNPDQLNSDSDYLGDACDPTPIHDLAILKTRAHPVSIARGSSWSVPVKVLVRNLTSSPEQAFVYSYASSSTLPFGCYFASWPYYQVVSVGALGSATLEFDYRIRCEAYATAGNFTVRFESQTFQWDTSNGGELDTSNNFGTATSTVTVL